MATEDDIKRAVEVAREHTSRQLLTMELGIDMNN